MANKIKITTTRSCPKIFAKRLELLDKNKALLNIKHELDFACMSSEEFVDIENILSIDNSSIESFLKDVKIAEINI